MTPPESPAARPQPWWRNGMIWLVAGLMVMVVGGNAVMIWIAVGAAPSLVRRDYYEASKHVDEEQAARRASAALHWSVSEVKDRRAADAVMVRIEDSAGKPLSGLTGSVRAYRPSDSSLDQDLRWQELPSEPGIYRATYDHPIPGLWRLTLDLRQGSSRLYKDLNIALPR